MTKRKKELLSPPDVEKLTRSQRRELGRRIWSREPGLEAVHPDAAGIDIGSREQYAAVPPERDAEPVRVYGCATEDLRQMAAWLKGCGIRTVAMQSTGVYWVPVYDVLEAAGLEVYLVNAEHTRNLPGRKSDVQESQWLMKLHTFGMLKNSFRPVSIIRSLRGYWRQRAEHVHAASRAIQRIQKALTEMNVQLSNVISDVSGLTGMRILRAIVAGERDGNKLAALRHRGIQAGEEEIARSLEGNWREELVFILRQELDTWDMRQRQMRECDAQIEKLLESHQTRQPGMTAQPLNPGRKPYKARGNAPHFDLRSELERIAGVDLTRIEGVDVMTAQTVVSEAGLDMSRWQTEGHFVSWLGLCPAHEISGGKVLKRRTRKVVNRAATALRLAASTLIKSQSYLGAQYRRLRTRLGAPGGIRSCPAPAGRDSYSRAQDRSHGERAPRCTGMAAS